MSVRSFEIVIFAGPTVGPSLQKLLRELGWSAWFAAGRDEADAVIDASNRILLLGDVRLDPMSFAQPGKVDVIPVGPVDPVDLSDAIRAGAVDWLSVPLSRGDLLRSLEVYGQRLLLETKAPVSPVKEESEHGMDPMTVATAILHEVNNPLTSLMAYQEDLREALDKHRLGRAREALSHCETTLEHVRTVARSGRTLLRKGDGPGNAMAAIQAAIVMVGRKRTPKVTTHMDVNMPAVTVPTHQLAQCILNLVVNAGKAGSRTVVISAIVLNDEVLIDVIDDGVGMNRETADRAMDMGFTTRGRGGSGIGLNMVKRLVERGGGRVELATQMGTGTQVRLRLPQAPPDY